MKILRLCIFWYNLITYLNRFLLKYEVTFLSVRSFWFLKCYLNYNIEEYFSISMPRTWILFLLKLHYSIPKPGDESCTNLLLLDDLMTKLFSFFKYKIVVIVLLILSYLSCWKYWNLQRMLIVYVTNYEKILFTTWW